MFNLQKGFPENFKWGSSTNAQQFEGGYKEGGKGLSDCGCEGYSRYARRI